MAMGTPSIARGTIANAALVVALASGQVANAAQPAAIATGVVSRAAVEAWEAPSLHTRVRVKLADEWIPEEDLVGEFDAEDPPLGTHIGFFSFTVRGTKYSVARNEDVFRLAPVEIFKDHGTLATIEDPEGYAEEGWAEPGYFEERVPDYAGYVIGCDQTSDHEPIVTIRCGDEAAAFDRYLACEEYAPLADYTRRQITEGILGAAGATLASAPSGGVYGKPLQTAGKNPFEILKSLWEPVGGHIRARGDRTFEIYIPQLKRPPQAPDAVWHIDDLQPINAVPPERVASRWVLPGTSAVVADELGFETRLDSTEISALYSPLLCTQRQALDGTLEAIGGTPEEERERVISRVTNEVVSRGGQVLAQDEREYGWHARRGPRLVPNTTGPGTASTGSPPEPGYDYVTSYVDDEGGFRFDRKESFKLIGQRHTVHNLDSAGNRDSSTVRTYRYHLRAAGVRATTTPDDETTAVGVYVYDDDMSYSAAFESYGLAEEQQIAYQRGAHGAEDQIVQDTFAFHSPRTANDIAGYYVRFDGTAQQELVANWRLRERQRETKLLNGMRAVTGTVKVLEVWRVARKADGAHDWGDFLSNASIERFGFISKENLSYTVETENQYEETTYPAEGGRQVKLFLGRLPITRYTQSVWTRLRSQPLEVIVDDDTAGAWWGYYSEAFEHPHVQNLAEAMRVIRDRRRRRIARKYETTRFDSDVKVGHTVLLVSPSDGILNRLMVVDKRPRWGIAPMATYTLEGW